ncbi:hypothetical protein [uncultured Rikenella sp.]|uniref:hypothetical protein n=1 Tax=uncultured Rikenella sp. TaxID=368003 RepID=UPI00261CE4F2|nr:hypothetical protein [uncultured Rikenella sp.]
MTEARLANYFRQPRFLFTRAPYLAPNPAPGYRNRDTGAPNGVGDRGYSWSSTASNTYGMSLSLHVTWLHPYGAYGRSYGYQLRCLSE